MRRYLATLVFVVFVFILMNGTALSAASPQSEMVKKAMPAVVGIGVDKRGLVSYRFSGSEFFEEFKKFYKDEEKEFKEKSKPQWDREKDNITPDDIEIQGSGFIFTKDGKILTNSHVVEGQRRVFILTNENKIYKARVLKESSKEDDDIAVLQIEGDPKEFPYVKLGDSDKVEIAEPVIAIGNPFGLTFTVTSGIVSAIRCSEVNDCKIQTDAAINHGNSGGPLINMNGEVIGINQAILRDPTKRQDSGGVNFGIAFAVPINKAKELMASSPKEGSGAYIGVGLDTTKGGDIVISHIEDGSPADDAGLREGDLIISIDGKEVVSAEEFVRYIKSKKPGDNVVIKIGRSGKIKRIDITLGKREG